MTFQVSKEDGLFHRQTLFDKAKRVVVKVGSAVVTTESGLNHKVLANIARELAFLQKTGREVILVTSGAVAAGKKKLDYNNSAEYGLKEKQAFAAIGQSCLMQSYDEVFARQNVNIAQLLLTHSDLADRDRYLNVRNTLLTLFNLSVIPIINENDTVSVEELRFGDNDTLAALITNLIEADMLICLTDVEGLYTGNPVTDPSASHIYTVAEITDQVENMAGNSMSSLGTGGMQSKIRAAKMVASMGGSSFIGPGCKDSILQHLFSGELIGTFFLPSSDKIKGRKSWIANVLRPRGKLVLDEGACIALKESGRSLLPSGVQKVSGTFGTGDAVQCIDHNGRVVAVGLVNYDSSSIDVIKGLHSQYIEEKLGYYDSDELIHRDNLVLM